MMFHIKRQIWADGAQQIYCWEMHRECLYFSWFLYVALSYVSL